MALAVQIEKIKEEISYLRERILNLEGRMALVEDKTKEEREVKQVVFDKEGAEVKVRCKVLVKNPRGYEEKWEEVTSVYKPEIIREVMQNGT